MRVPPTARGAALAGALGAALLALAAVASPAAAQRALGCGPDLDAWAASCGARLVACPPGHAVVAVGPGRLRVDVTRQERGAFATAPGLGLSPVLEVASWSEVPAADRAAFEALVACARAAPTVLAASLAQVPEPPRGAGAERGGDRTGDPGDGAPPLPWLAAVGGLLGLAAASLRHGVRASLRTAVAPLSLTAATFAGRALLVPEQYFHQNGQGPLWVSHALGEPSAYGPGYAELFHLAVRHAADPDGALILQQGLLAALVPGAVLAQSRWLGAPLPVALALALGTATSPLLARLARGESYFAAALSLLALASLTLAASWAEPSRSGGPPRATRAAPAVGAAGAGLLLAQAARLHPLAWLPAALVPLVVGLLPEIASPGRRSAAGAESTVAASHPASSGDTAPSRASGAPRRLRRAALAAALAGTVALSAAGPSLLDVLRGPLGASWLGPEREGGPRDLPLWLVAAALVAALAPVAARRAPALAARRAAARTLSATAAFDLRSAARLADALALVVGVAIVAWMGNLLGAAPPYVHHAYLALYLPPLTAAAAAVAAIAGARTSLPAPAVAGAVLAAATGLHAAGWPDDTRVPTDAREGGLLRAWRDTLPPDAVVVYLERADRQIVNLPLYFRRTVRLSTQAPPPDLRALGGRVFYYRSGLCSTRRGRASCDALEARATLETVHEATLPAVPSFADLAYEAPTVRVALYRVVDDCGAVGPVEGGTVDDDPPGADPGGADPPGADPPGADPREGTTSHERSSAVRDGA